MIKPGRHGEQHNTMTRANTLIKWIIMVILAWQATFNISDSAIQALFGFLCKILSVLAFEAPFIACIRDSFPKCNVTALKRVGIENDSFQKFVVCGSCNELYPDINDLIYSAHGTIKARTCSNQILYNRRRVACGQPLLKKSILEDGKCTFIPIKTYCYKSIVESIEELLNRKGMLNECQKWRSREVPSGYLADIFDGAIWKKRFHSKDEQGRYFLDTPSNLGLMLNVDWYQPYQRKSDCSVGAIYCTIMNLPRELRNKRENVLLVGIIPNFDNTPNLDKSLMTYMDFGEGFQCNLRVIRILFVRH